MRRFALALGALCLLATGGLAAGCTSGQAPAAAPAGSAAAPLASASKVTSVAQLICSAEAGEDIQASIGVAPTKPVTSTFVQQVYSCPYVYDGGTMTLSVREYPDTVSTDAAWAADRSTAAPATDLPAIGDQAFAAPDGSVFVRKDAKVLHVDVSGLPARFGVPARSRAGIAQIVAVVVMNCWKEG